VKELSSSRDDYPKFQAVDAEVIGVSINVRFSQQAFADFLKLNYPLLSDFPEGKTTQAYGVLNAERKLAQRAWFIVDKQGVVRYKKGAAGRERSAHRGSKEAQIGLNRTWYAGSASARSSGRYDRRSTRG
jgi:peroxiredoxin